MKKLKVHNDIEEQKKTFLHLSKIYPTPKKVQDFLKSFKYNREVKGETLRSAHRALLIGEAHCLEAALIAAAILEHRGFSPLVAILQSIDGLDHVLFIYKIRNRWGAVGRSRDEGLHGRPARYRTIADLIGSYFDPYIDKTGKLTGFQVANLDDMGVDWRFSSKFVWKVEKSLLELKCRPIRRTNERYRRVFKRYLAEGPMKRLSYWW